MKRLYIYIILCTIACLTSCRQERLAPTSGEAVLELDLQRVGHPSASVTRAVDEDLAVDVFRQDGSLFVHYDAGQVARKIVFEQEGTYRVVAYTDNQYIWFSANNGKGEGCYMRDTTIVMEYDMVKRLQMRVPMTNYAVTLTLPELFHDLFPAYTFTVASGTRSINLREGEKVYLSPYDAGFTYKLSVTNYDGEEHSASEILYTDVQRGKLYNLRYSFANSNNSGGIDIVIEDNTETEDTDVDL